MPAQSPWVQIDPALRKSNPELAAYADANPEAWAAAQAAAKKEMGPYSSFTDGVTGVAEPGKFVGNKVLIEGNKPKRPDNGLYIDLQPSSFKKSAPAAAPAKKRPPAAPPVVPPQPGATQAAPPAPLVNDGSYYGADDTEYKRLLMLLDEAEISGIDMQKKGLADQEADLAEVQAKEPKVDLSALMNYSDTTYGSNLLAGYKRPLDQEALDTQERGLQEAIQKNRQGLSEDQIKILDSALTAEGRRLGIDDASLTRQATSDQTAVLKQLLGNQTDATKRLAIAAGITEAQIAAAAKNGGPDGKLLSEKMINTIDDYDKANSLLQEIITEKPGIATGPGPNLQNRAGIFFGMDDAKVTAFRAKVQDQLSKYIHEMSGTAASDSERKFLIENTISMNDSNASFVLKANNLLRHNRENRGRYVKLLGNTGRNVKGVETPPPAAPAASAPAAPARKVMSAKDLP